MGRFPAEGKDFDAVLSELKEGSDTRYNPKIVAVMEKDRELKERYPENPDYLRGYSVVLGRMAGIFEARNKSDLALAYYEEELAIDRELKERYPENPRYIDVAIIVGLFRQNPPNTNPKPVMNPTVRFPRRGVVFSL